MNRRIKKKIQNKIPEQTYENYVKRYNQRRKNLAHEGISMSMEKYTREEWEIMKDLVKSEIADIKDINKELVNRNAYFRSEAQSKSYAQALELKGINVKVRDLKYGISPFAEEQVEILKKELEDYDERLKEEGYTGTKRKKIIGAQFFGSL